jgi:hypothetical protein
VIKLDKLIEFYTILEAEHVEFFRSRKLKNCKEDNILTFTRRILKRRSYRFGKTIYFSRLSTTARNDRSSISLVMNATTTNLNQQLPPTPFDPQCRYRFPRIMCKSIERKQ